MQFRASMKRAWLVFSFMVLTPFMAGAAEGHDPPLAEVLARATREHKPVFLDFWTIWCAPCAMLDRDVFPQPAVQAALADYVVQHYDADVGEGARLAELFHVAHYPTMMVLSPDGAEVDSLNEWNPAALAKHLRAVAPRAVETHASPSDVTAGAEARRLESAARQAADSDDLDGAISLYQQAEAADPGNAASVANSASFHRLQLEARVAEMRMHGEMLLAYAAAHPGTEETKTALGGIAGLPRWARPAEAALAAAADKSLAVIVASADSPSIDLFLMVLLVLDLHETAQAGADAFAKLAADDPSALGTVAEVYFQNGHADQALEILSRALALDPRAPQLLAARQRFSQGITPGSLSINFPDPLAAPSHAMEPITEEELARKQAQVVLEHAVADHCHAQLSGYADPVSVRVYVKAGKVSRVVVLDPEMGKPLRGCVEAALKGLGGLDDAGARESYTLRPPAR